MPQALSIIVKAAITLALLWLLFRKVDYGATLGQVWDIRPLTGFLGVLVLYAAMALAAVRWRIILRSTGARCAARALFRLNLIGLFFNQALPSAIGGDGMRVWLLYRRGFPLGKAFNSVLLDRIAGFGVLAIMSLYGLPTVAQLLFKISKMEAAIGIASLSIAMLALLVVLASARAWLSRFRPGRVIAQIVTDVLFFVKRPGDAATIALLSIASQALSFVLIWLIMRDLGSDVPFAGLLVVAPVVLLLLVLPISIAGWGLREGLFVVGFGLLGVPRDVALAASIVYGLINLVAGLIGGALWLLGSTRSRPQTLDEPATALD